jgi:hypothetical protein
VQETQGARGIEPVGGVNRRNVEVIAFNPQRGVEARQRATPINLGQARVQRPPEHAARQHQQESQSAKQHAAPSPYASDFHVRTVSQRGEGTTKGRFPPTDHWLLITDNRPLSSVFGFRIWN